MNSLTVIKEEIVWILLENITLCLVIYFYIGESRNNITT